MKSGKRMDRKTIQKIRSRRIDGTKLRFSETDLRRPFILEMENREPIHLTKEDVAGLMDDCLTALWMEKDSHKQLKRSG